MDGELGERPRVWRSEGLVWLALLGGLAADAAWVGRAGPIERGERRATSSSPSGSEVVGGASLDLSRASPRELRRLPGIGEQRAIDIAEARWNLPPGAPARPLTSIRGIGPATEARVRAALALLSAKEPASIGSGGSEETSATVHSTVSSPSASIGIRRPPNSLSAGTDASREPEPTGRDP